MLAINEDRMLADLRALAEFGRVGTGVNRAGIQRCGYRSPPLADGANASPPALKQ